MELKLLNTQNVRAVLKRFNRTFMELKCCYWCCCQCWQRCFNRTFMELKLVLSHIFRNLLTVLIVPLWN